MSAARGRPALLALLAAALLIGGCAGGRPPLAAWQSEFARYDRDARALGPVNTAGDVLRTAQEGAAEADSLARQGKKARAAVVLRRAVADARAALAAAEMSREESRADACAVELEGARRGRDDAMRGLIQAEQVAKRTAEGVPHGEPSGQPERPRLPETSFGDNGTPLASDGEIQAAWDAWSTTAHDVTASTADLEGRYESARAAAGRGSSAERALARREAGRIVQELEARVRGRAAEEACTSATREIGRLGDARAAALRGTLELERGLQDALRQKLEEVRAEAQSREDQLYDAMRSLEGKYASIRRDARGTIVSLADILFDFNKATLRRDVEFSLVRVSTILNQFPEMKVRVEGHTDNIGREDYNLDLSQRRAQAVLDFLVSQGVAAERLTSEGFGMSRPISDNATAEGRQQNRRVDLVIEEAQ